MRLACPVRRATQREGAGRDTVLHRNGAECALPAWLP